MADPASDDAARNRWAAIQALRLSGVAMVLVGILVARQIIGLPVWAGYLLLIVGLADVFVVPTLLARKWRSPRE